MSREAKDEEEEARTSEEEETMNYIRTPLREVDREKWLDWDDKVYRRKQISTWIVELVGGTERGGMILLWEKKEMGDEDEVGSLAWEMKHEDNLGYFSEKYSHIEFEENHYRLFDEVNFMNYSSAKAEYDDIDLVENITDLAWRNR